MKQILIDLCSPQSSGIATFFKDYQILIGGLLAFIAGIITYRGYRRGHRLEAKKLSRQELAFLWVFKIVVESMREVVTEAKEDLENRIDAVAVDVADLLFEEQLVPVELPLVFLEPW